MASNQCVPYFEPSGHLNAVTTANVVGCTFVDVSGAQTASPDLNTSVSGSLYSVATAAAGAAALGVSEYDAAKDLQLGVYTGPMIVPVTAGADIASGAEVEVGSDGAAITLSAGRPVGKCMTAATSGTLAQIKLY